MHGLEARPGSLICDDPAPRLFALFLLALVWKNQYMKRSFLIPDFDMTQGGLRLGFGAEEVGTLEAGGRDPDPDP